MRQRSLTAFPACSEAELIVVMSGVLGSVIRLSQTNQPEFYKIVEFPPEVLHSQKNDFSSGCRRFCPPSGSPHSYLKSSRTCTRGRSARASINQARRGPR
jgi:hypothetical protein